MEEDEDESDEDEEEEEERLHTEKKEEEKKDKSAKVSSTDIRLRNLDCQIQPYKTVAEAKLADFGFSRLLAHQDCKNYIGTMVYACHPNISFMDPSQVDHALRLHCSRVSSDFVEHGCHIVACLSHTF